MAPGGCAKRQRGGFPRDDFEAKKVRLDMPIGDEAEAKKVRFDGPVQRMLQIVCEAVGSARDRAEDCQAMLESMVEGSLAKGCDERDEFQEEAVRMIGDIISKLETDAITQLNRKEAIVRDPDGTKATIHTELREALEVNDEADKDVNEKTKRLKEARKSVSEAQKRLVMCKKTLGDHIATQDALVEEKCAFENAYSTHFTALRDGVWDTQPEAETHVLSLIPLFKRFDYEESLINAFMPAAQHKPCDRRHFDKIVVDQAEKSFLQHTEDLERNIRAAEPGLDRSRAAVESGEAAVNDAVESDRATGLSLGKALMAQRSSRHLLRDGRQALDDFPRDPHQAENDRDVANQALQRFRRGPYEAYTVLRDRVAALELMTPSADSYHLALAGA